MKLIKINRFQITLLLCGISILFLTSCAKHIGVVSRVIDGDTLELKNGQKVRLIGLDAPETRRNHRLQRQMKQYGLSADQTIDYGRRSKKYLDELTGGKKVKIKYGKDRHDRYGRILAYMYLDDGTFLNERIIEDGYAVAFIKYPFKYKNKFLEAEINARNSKRGLWNIKGR